jgi:hypothetical protein
VLVQYRSKDVPLRVASRALDGLADVLALQGLCIAANVDANKLGARSATDDLASLRAILPPKTKKAAYVWHTRPLLRDGFIRRLEKGRLMGVQSAEGKISSFLLCPTYLHGVEFLSCA